MSLTVKSIASLAFLVAISSLSLNAEGYGSRPHGNGKDNSLAAVANSISDQELNRRIHKQIDDSWYARGYRDVKIHASDGTVTLSGSVETEKDKNEIESSIRNIEGVKALNSKRLVVKNANPKERSTAREFPQDRFATQKDDQLNRKIRDNISKGWLWDSHKDITLQTSNGIVTVLGNIDDAKAEEKLIGEIKKIEGVKSVISNLRIQNKNYKW